MHREVREQANPATRTVSADGRRFSAVVLLGVAAFFVGARSGWALGGTPCVSNDNHVYYIVHTSSAFAQVTSVALTDATASACSEQGSTGTVLTSLATGVNNLLPNRMRTSVLTGMNDVNLSCIGDFHADGAGGKGILEMHSPSARFVSVDPTACKNDSSVNPGSVNCEQITAVSNSDATAGISGAGVTGSVPAAMDLASVSRTSLGCATSGTTMVFPNPAGTISLSSDAAGEQSGQTVTLGDTAGSTVGNVAGGFNPHTVGTTQPNPDGFTLQGVCDGTIQMTCEVIVFIASLDGNLGFAAGAAGFTTDSNLVQSATESTASNGSFILPTQTPTSTPTPTTTPPTSTPTGTSTRTSTPTSTATRTPTLTATPGKTPNDACNDPRIALGTLYSDTTTTSAATTETTDPFPSCGNGSRSKSVWYRFTAPSSGTLTADTFGSDYDTLLSTYTGSCGAFSPVSGGCNDDVGGGKQSQVSFAASAGTTYSFMITAFNSDGGTLVFNLAFHGSGTETPTATATPTPYCCGDCDGDGYVSAADLNACLRITVGLPSNCAVCDCSPYDGIVDINDVVRAAQYQNGCPGYPALTPTATATNTATETPISTQTPTPSPTDTSTPTPPPTSTLTPILTPTNTSTQTATDTPTAMPTVTPTTTETRLQTPTHTATSTPTLTPTTTPTAQATVTPTPTVTPTVLRLSCIGDCNDSHDVTVDELLSLVNIALGNADASTCTEGDANHDGQITVDEILAAVNNALNGCTPSTPQLGWHLGCGPPVVRQNACSSSVQVCTTSQQLGASCNQAGATCCQPGSDCTDDACNHPLLCSTTPPDICPL